jgi:hypothetical protein
MSDCISADIWIGGNIPERLVPELCEIITREGVVLEWGEGPFQPKTVQDLKVSLRENDRGEWLLWLCDDQASWGQFENLERFLREHGLSYTRRSEGRYEYDPELVEHRPGYGTVSLVTNVAGCPVVLAKDLTPVAHLLDAAIELSEKDADPRLLSLVQTALKLVREQLTPEVLPQEPFSIEPTCGSTRGQHDDQEAQDIEDGKAPEEAREESEEG